MIGPPRCYKRDCIHYLGIYSPNEDEVTQVPHCIAFPLGIPEKILSGKNDHLKPLKDQGNNIVFEVILE